MEKMKAYGCKKVSYEINGTEIIAELQAIGEDQKTFMGKAKYNPEDEKNGNGFNEDFGKRLALVRAMDKMILANCKKYDKLDNDIHREYIKMIKHKEKVRKTIAKQADKNDLEAMKLEKELADRYM